MNKKHTKKSLIFGENINGKKRGGIGAVLFILIIGAAIIFGAYYAATTSGSRERLNENFTNEIDTEKAIAFLKESEELESKFNSIHAVKKDKISSEDIGIYEKAISAYEKYMKFAGIDGSVNVRADKMRVRVHSLRAEKARERSSELEAEADKLFSAKKYGEAAKKYKEAYELEDLIEKKYRLSGKANAGRVLSLKNRMQIVHSIPRRERAEKLEKEGTEALEKREWEIANSKLREALKIQQDLWNNYRIAVVNGSEKIANLNGLVETAASSVYLVRQEAAEKIAENAEKDEDFQGAKVAWEKALDEFSALEKNYPRSKFASKKNRERFLQKIANADAFPSFLELKKIVREIQEEIISGTIENIPLLARKAVMSAAKISEDFPGNTLVPEDLKKMLAFLDVKSNGIAQIQKPFLEKLLPIPGIPENEKKMLATEISQAFFSFVMGENPSADKESLNAPVESVSYSDAEKFAQNLSLICGYEVRLPTGAEYEAALGDFVPEEILEEAWTLENSGAKIHDCATKKANKNGFFDLIGNVSEWIYIVPGEKKRMGREVFGGDCQSLIEMLEKNKIEKAWYNEKSRIRGFRVVVDFSKPIDFLEFSLEDDKK